MSCEKNGMGNLLIMKLVRYFECPEYKMATGPSVCKALVVGDGPIFRPQFILKLDACLFPFSSSVTPFLSFVLTKLISQLRCLHFAPSTKFDTQRLPSSDLPQ